MAVSSNTLFTSTKLTRVLSLLETIKSNDAGALLYDHIERSLHKQHDSQQESEQLFLDLLGTLLNHLSRQIPGKSPLQVQIFILKKTLTPGLSNTELSDCYRQLEEIIKGINHAADDTPADIQQSLNNLVDNISQANAETGIDTTPMPEAATTASEQIEPIFAQPIQTDIDTQLEKLNAATTPTPEAPLPIKTAKDVSHVAEFQPDAPFCFADQTRDSIENIHSSLSEQIESAREFNNELARLLSSSLSVISHIDKNADLKVAKQTFLRRYTKLIKMHQDLTTKFDSVDDNLSSIETHSENLSAELNRVHRLGFTDELTGLPNRRAFLQRFDDEIARARRYHSPLTLALLDLDHFKSINDSFGHAAGDDILQLVSRHMKAIFRYHDIAARYGGEEFAVLFPNTNIEGASLALNKLQERMGNDVCIIDNNEEIPVPSFSAGLALFNGEEDPEDLIQRADTALYDAKNCGRCRIEVHMHDVPDWPDDVLAKAAEDTHEKAR